MIRRILVTICLALIFISTTGQTEQGSFFAYYTSISHGEKFEEFSRTGNYADIKVVTSDRLQVCFWRGSSYLPYLKSEEGTWYFDEIVSRYGDGDEKMPDRLNRYSYVRLIESSEQKIIVHWRYVPDFGNPTFTGVVDEYFLFTPDNKVVRTIRKGTGSIDEWESMESMIVQVLQLGQSGIEEISLARGQNVSSDMDQKHESDPVSAGDEDIINLPLDETKGSSTQDHANKWFVPVAGHKVLWKEGISGSCLHFDGYYSSVALPGHLSQDIREEILVEGWVALGAYPFDWGPVVHQSTWDHSGFYLGVDKEGQAGFHVTIDGEWHSIISDKKLELFRWYHLAGTVDKKGEITLHIDGQAVKSLQVDEGTITLSNTDLMIGLNSEKMPAGPGRIRMGKYPSLFGIDGLIDEVRMSREVPGKITGLPANIPAPDMEPRCWPVQPDEATGQFSASYTKLKYYETWDNMWRVSDHPDVVVSFDEIPGRIISWRGLSNGPVLVTENNLWIGDQSSENYKEMDADEAEGCCEHMSDKQCRHAHIRIIENTDARIVIHYRYGMVDSRYIFPDVDPETGWGDWADEIWTIYPDGVAVRHLERGMIWGDSWVETMFFSAPGQHPEDVVETEAFTVVNEEGESETWSWEDGSPDQVYEDIVIATVNTRSEFKSFNIYPTESSVEVFGGHGRNSKFHWWNHWPVSQITSDGRGAWAADRAAHSSLVWGIPSKPYLLYGLSNKPAKELTNLARSWNFAPEIVDITGARSLGYDQKQRAYILEKTGSVIDLVLNASDESPAVNPCLIVKGWISGDKASISAKGAEHKSRQGIIRDTDGSQTLVVWMKAEAKQNVSIQISE